MVDNRLKFLNDLQINVSLEERGRERGRGMIISGNLRGTPEDRGAVSGINKDIKVSVLPQASRCFL